MPLRQPHFLFCVLILIGSGCTRTVDNDSIRREVGDFLKLYNSIYQGTTAITGDAQWFSMTEVNEAHTGQRTGAGKVYAAFSGNREIIERTRRYLAQKDKLDESSARQLEKIFLIAAQNPGTIPEIVNLKVEAEAQQSAAMDGFQFKLSGKPTTANEIDKILEKSRNLEERRKVWEASKEIGKGLKPGLVKLQPFRNKVAKEMGYSSYFALQVADYGMSASEMMQFLNQLVEETRPFYQQLHCWVRNELAKRYHQRVPKRIPAHWLGNRWSQEWPGIVEGVDLDSLFIGKDSQWIVRQAESFYTSLGMPPLPESFWKKSDLYPLPAASTRKKNAHASAWHIDLQNDVRSLMSVEPNFYWFSTAHHELGHAYYFMAYSNPEVPFVLREGANRAFHEAIGDLIAIATGQVPYLQQIGLLPGEKKIDRTQWLLDEALRTLVFIPWSAGVMSHWEYDLYEQNLPESEYNTRWWKYVGEFQGVEPPTPRSETYCDPATKTHINDDAAQYYDYAMAFAIKYQLHNHIAKNILKQDPNYCNYYNNKEVGKFLMDILKLGATRDWRQVLREKTGEDISSKALLEYFKPVLGFLQKQNAGREAGWD